MTPTNSHNVFHAPVFSFKNGPLKRLPFNKPPRTSFLDFSAEIRNLIYSYAAVVPFVIRNDDVKRSNLKARHPDWKHRDRITDCFNFMQSCRQVYKEASPVFWGCNVFLLQAEPAGGITTFEIDPQAAIDLTLDLFDPWTVHFGVQSRESRKRIRKLAWIYGKDVDPILRRSNDWRRVSCCWRCLKHSGLQNVSELTVIFDQASTNVTRLPSPNDMDAFVNQMLGENASDFIKFMHKAVLAERAEAARAGTLEYLRFFVFEGMSSIQAIRLGGVLPLAWEPHKVLTEDSPFIQDISSELRSWNRTCESAGIQVLTACEICGEEWTEEHSSKSPDGLCPSLLDEDDKLRRYNDALSNGADVDRLEKMEKAGYLEAEQYDHGVPDDEDQDGYED